MQCEVAIHRRRRRSDISLPLRSRATWVRVGLPSTECYGRVLFMILYQDNRSSSKLHPASGDLRGLIQQIRPYLGWHLASVALVLAGSLLSLVDPLVMRWFIDRALPARSTSSIASGVVLIFLSYQGRVLFNSCGGYLSFRANQQFILNLRLKLHDTVRACRPPITRRRRSAPRRTFCAITRRNSSPSGPTYFR